MRRNSDERDIQGFERVFNIIGWIGFLAIVPIALSAFGVPQVLQWTRENMGRYGTGQFFLIVFFILVFIRVIFGSGRIILPLIISAASGFILMSSAAGVSFMAWYESLVSGSRFFGNVSLNFLTGVAVVIIGIGLSYFRRLSVFMQILLLVILPVAFLIFAGATGLMSGLDTLPVGVTA